jgi:uncharacterized protein (DUF1015 family)
VPWKKHQEYDTSLKYNVQPKVKSFFEINQTGKNLVKSGQPRIMRMRIGQNWYSRIFTGDISSLALKNKVFIMLSLR